ncbi:hypothetical protein HPB51_029333 [Rhipicephalus microplus]|uniref:Retrotransposon gag domain-containing protein n=1 Tax=Rhipicephalus microplus TaxID=6941 RepID=A0A9J6CV33_RHIMP|nr:hypothetical protein HPB51_029333 [Rhipicephalus microplus]
MAQSFNEPMCDDLREETVLRSRRTLQRPAASATVAMASDPATAGTEASALPAGILAKPRGDSTDLASQTASLPRNAVHAPLYFASGNIPGATSVPSPEDRHNSSPVAASELCTVLQAITTSSQRLADATVTFSAACACTTLPPPSMAEIPDFTGFDQEPTAWLDEIHSLARRHAWTDDVTLSLAVSRLRESGKAWHQYNGCKYQSWSDWTTAFVTAFPPLPSAYNDHFMRMRSRRQAPSEDARKYVYDKLGLLDKCGITWISPAAHQYVVDGLADPTHAAILSCQSPEASPQLGQIVNGDETPTYLDMPLALTVHQKGSRQVNVRSTGNEKRWVTVMFCIEDGRNLPPYEKTKDAAERGEVPEKCRRPLPRLRVNGRIASA